MWIFLPFLCFLCLCFLCLQQWWSSWWWSQSSWWKWSSWWQHFPRAVLTRTPYSCSSGNSQSTSEASHTRIMFSVQFLSVYRTKQPLETRSHCSKLAAITYIRDHNRWFHSCTDTYRRPGTFLRTRTDRTTVRTDSSDLAHCTTPSVDSTCSSSRSRWPPRVWPLAQPLVTTERDTPSQVSSS